MFAEAEVLKGDQLVRRDPGGPKSELTKQEISVRLDSECRRGGVRSLPDPAVAALE
jgi:hypothetical protein